MNNYRRLSCVALWGVLISTILASVCDQSAGANIEATTSKVLPLSSLPPPPPPPTRTLSPGSSGAALGIVWIIGIVCAVVAVVGLFGVALWWFCFRNKSTRNLQKKNVKSRRNPLQKKNVNAACSSNDLAIDVAKEKEEQERVPASKGAEEAA